MKRPESGTNPVPNQPLAAEGGVRAPVTTARDPYETLDDLMVVVEMLCPQWPARGTFKIEGLWLL